MVDGVTAGEDNGSIFRKFDVLLTKFARCDVIQFDEFLESEVHSILLRHISKRRLRYVGRLGL